MNNLGSHINKTIYAAALIISCCFVCSCENSQKEIDRLTKPSTMVEEATNVESYLSQEGDMKAKLVAPLMYRVLADTLYVEFPNSLHVDFYDDSTKVESWVDAKYGKYFEALNKVYLRDSVIVISRNKDTLWCHDLWWDQNTQMFYTADTATYHSPGDQVTGFLGMEATQDLKTVTFKLPTALMQMTGDRMGN
jgi:LPS export ABC transporter protein LptC